MQKVQVIVAPLDLELRKRVQTSLVDASIEASPPTVDEARLGGESIREFDVLVEHDVSLLVAHDVVAVQAVAELIEIVFALGALVAFCGEISARILPDRWSPPC